MGPALDGPDVVGLGPESVRLSSPSSRQIELGTLALLRPASEWNEER